MSKKVQKSDQVLWLEGALKRPLFQLECDVTGYGYRKCCQVDARGNIIGLNLANCRLQETAFLQKLDRLTTLNLSRNEIRDGSFLKGMEGLTTLDLSGNTFGDGRFLLGLTTLNLSLNNFSDWSFLKGMEGLRTLDIRSNQLEKLPRELLELGTEIESDEHQHLPGSINVAGNPLTEPPLEIVGQGHAAVVAYFASLKGGEEERPLNEVKVILVGDGGGGQNLASEATKGRFRISSGEVSLHCRSDEEVRALLRA